MPQWKPDQTFYPSPKMAMQSSQESLAYVGMLDPARSTPDALAVVDVDPGLKLNRRSDALAARLESGAAALTAFAETLSEAEWQTRLPKDGRKVGVVVHHVASMYPLEIQLASLLAVGEPITGVTGDAVDTINRDHAEENDSVTKEAALALLGTNSAAAAAAVRAFTDAQLDRAAPVSLNSDAPLTCQFFLEDHPVRHSYHHLARIKTALGR